MSYYAQLRQAKNCCLPSATNDVCKCVTFSYTMPDCSHIVTHFIYSKSTTTINNTGILNF